MAEFVLPVVLLVLAALICIALEWYENRHRAELYDWEIENGWED